MNQIFKTLILFVFLFFDRIHAQNAEIRGKVQNEGLGIPNIKIELSETSQITSTDSLGNFRFTNLSFGNYELRIQHEKFRSYQKNFSLKAGDTISLNIELHPKIKTHHIQDVVVSGTMKQINRLESPVAVEVYTPTFFRKNPTPSIFDALQNTNGVRPQLNCNICNTGDIHINGLEGPYTMVMIDGMPIVSSLGSVYGLSGIPNALVERIEIIKGPASSLYGSEAVGGLINIITKSPSNSPVLSSELMSTTWEEYHWDVAFRNNIGRSASILTGINYFNYNRPIDQNKDGFTDVTLQDRVSIFQKWNIYRKENRLFSFALRYLYEDRWGGDMRWTPFYRGSNTIYGESIYTSRTELIGNYQLPIKEKMFLSFSLINHDQDSRYGTTTYIANQKIAFGQVTWDKNLGNHDWLLGAALRYTYYDDNTPATSDLNQQNNPDKSWLPGIFLQDEISLSSKHKIMLGLRYDYHSRHKHIITPRLAYKWTLDNDWILRLNAGTGFRVVNIFTEDHAALTGAREVILIDSLNPEKSYNLNLNTIKKIYFDNGSYLNMDITAFYTYFTNRIAPDYETHPNQIIYKNLDGYAVSKGLSFNVDWNLANGLKVLLGGTLMDNILIENGLRRRPLLTEKFMGTWTISYRLSTWKLNIDYTGNLYSPMSLPLLSALDPRKPYSPWWSLQNIQVTYNGFKKVEIFAGIKNLLNWTPNRGNPFIIARSHDPFDEKVIYDDSGQIVPTSENPYALSFDPSYVYAPNQGIRGFLGIRFNLN